MSLSAFRVDALLITSRLPGADDSKFIRSFCVNYYEKPTLAGDAVRSASNFSFRVIGIREREGQRIAKHSDCFVERDAMLAQITRSFFRIPFEVEHRGRSEHSSLFTRPRSGRDE